MEDPRFSAPPADMLDRELATLLRRIAAEPVSAALTTCALELNRALETAGRRRPGKADKS